MTPPDPPTSIPKHYINAWAGGHDPVGPQPTLHIYYTVIKVVGHLQWTRPTPQQKYMKSHESWGEWEGRPYPHDGLKPSLTPH